MQIKANSLERKLKNLVRSRVSIYFAHSILSNTFFGKLIKVFKIKRNLFGGKFDYSLVSDKEAAKIFFGIWESAEINFSKRFAHTKTIIELGSSVGVTLGVLSNIRKQTKFICVEASWQNYDKLERLQKQLSKSNEYILINKAIAYGVEKVNFEFSSTTGSKIGENKYSNSNISAITLSKILHEHDINDEFTLITDIEGAEEQIFFEDEAALQKCICIIAELEDTSSNSIDQQINRLKGIGYSLIERYGSVIVMRRQNNLIGRKHD